MDTNALPSPDEMRFSDAMAELQTILSSLENEDVELDDLSARVERAAALIRSCRARIASTEMKVNEVIDELREEVGTESTDS